MDYTSLSNDELDARLSRACEVSPEGVETDALFAERSRRIRATQAHIRRCEVQYSKTGWWPDERGKGYVVKGDGMVQIKLTRNQLWLVTDYLEAMEADESEYVLGATFATTTIENWYGVEAHIYPDEVAWAAQASCDSENDNRIDFAEKQGRRAAEALEKKILRVLGAVDVS